MLRFGLTFCVFTSHLTVYKTINIPEIFSGVHGVRERPCTKKAEVHVTVSSLTMKLANEHARISVVIVKLQN